MLFSLSRFLSFILFYLFIYTFFILPLTNKKKIKQGKLIHTYPNTHSLTYSVVLTLAQKNNTKKNTKKKNLKKWIWYIAMKISSPFFHNIKYRVFLRNIHIFHLFICIHTWFEIFLIIFIILLYLLSVLRETLFPVFHLFYFVIYNNNNFS